MSTDQNAILNDAIDQNFSRIPALRLILLTARHFFNMTKAKRKNRKIKEKRKWLWAANIVLTQYEDIGNHSQAAQNFENYCSGPAEQIGNNSDDD